MAAPLYSYGEFMSKDYRWRPHGRILVSVFSQTFPLGNADQQRYWKIFEEHDEFGNIDVDFSKLRQLFHKNAQLFPVPVDIEYRTSLSFDEYKSYLEEVNQKEVYDCFFFIFLTYSTPEYGNTYNEEKIHFNDKTKENGVIPQAKVIDEVMRLKVAVGKPKIILIQADDISFFGPKEYMKGPTAVPDIKSMKISQDADRVIIKSTIPQKLANLDDNGRFMPYSNKPSMLIEAFVETLLNNVNRKQNEKKDFYSLTSNINGKVTRRIRSLNHLRQGDMYAPLVTSTLTKFLYL